MNLQIFLILFLLVPDLVSGQKFSRQVYLLSDHFLKEKCEVTAPCDCCASDLIFLSKTKFTLVDRCLSHETYLTGRYTVAKTKLTLKFKPVVIDNIFDEKSKQELVEKKEIRMVPLILQIHMCGDKFVFEHPSIKEYKYGARQTTRNDKEIISALKKSKAWKVLFP
ncbi:MAG: hypothetical protein SH818_13615 [Saprospiraceae bacterium]|nr:hypothetical protein [Saprospiraceae bacterium]